MPVALRGKWQVATWRVVSGKLQVTGDQWQVPTAWRQFAATAATKREVQRRISILFSFGTAA